MSPMEQETQQSNQQEANQKERLWTAPYILLIIMGTMTATCFYLVNPTIAKYATTIGATVTLAGVIAGLFSITALVARPFSGLIADRVNRKLLLVTATAVMGVAAAGYSISTSIPMLIAFRVLHGIAFSVSGTVNVTMIASLVPRSRLSEGVGYYGLANIFATAIGPSLGLGLGDAFGYSVSFLISGIGLGVAALFASRIPFHNIPSPQKSKKGFHFSDLISFRVLPIAVLGGIFSMSNGIITSYLALMGDARGIVGISAYFTVNALVLLLIRPFAGKLADRKGPKFIVYPAMVLDGLALFLLGRAQMLWMVLTAAVFKACGQGAGQPTLQAYALKKLPPEKSGVASSTYYIGADVGQGLGPMAAGAVVDGCGADSQGYGIMFTVSSLLFVVGLIGYTVYSKFEQKSKK